MAELDDRMPVILKRQGGWPIWLGEAEGDHAVLFHLQHHGADPTAVTAPSAPPFPMRVGTQHGFP
jgi:hypothetical protein